MAITSLWRFWVATGALWGTAQLVGGMKLGLLAAMILAVVLAVVGALMDSVWPSDLRRASGVLGWLTASGVLFAAQWVVPFYHATFTAAVIAGGLLWLLDRVFPIVFG